MTALDEPSAQAAPAENAYQLLSASPLGDMPHILARWKKINWRRQEAEVPGVDAQVASGAQDTINLFPGLDQKPPKAQAASLIREFGICVTQDMDDDLRHRWELKFCLPEQGQIDAVQAKLSSGKYGTYRDLTESFTTAMDRLVSLNICNALLANHVPRTQAVNLKIATWGATAAYANLRRLHSIKPLLYAYCARETAECPGRALAELVVNGMKGVREASVGNAFKNLIVELYRSCR